MLSKTSTKVDFDAKAGQWDSDPRQVYMAQKIARGIIQSLHLSHPATALELGAGTGLATLLMAKHVAALDAMDNSQAMLDVLVAKCVHKNYGHVHALHGQAPDDLPHKTYDAVYSAMTLHHIEDVAGLFNVLFKHVSKGGQIAMADLDKEDGSFHGRDVEVPHKGFARAKIKTWLEQAGFAEVSFSTIFTIERQADDGSSLTFPVFLAHAQKPSA